MPRTILIVDDEPAVRRLLAKWLQADGFIVIEAATGGEAIAAAQESLLDAIVMDVMLPDMNGFVATERIRTVPGFRSIPVIGLTGLDVRIDVAHEGGCTDLLSKPVEREALLEMVRRYIKSDQPRQQRYGNKHRIV
jgi:CheY-like chemotaxis protein